MDEPSKLEQACKRKRVYPSKAAARRWIRTQRHRLDKPVRPYRCTVCHQFHVTSASAEVTASIKAQAACERSEVERLQDHCEQAARVMDDNLVPKSGRLMAVHRPLYEFILQQSGAVEISFSGLKIIPSDSVFEHMMQAADLGVDQ